jgi:hypothetical protein
MLKLFDLYYSVYPGHSETVRGSNFYYSWSLLLLCFTLCPFVTKRGSNFYFWTGNVFPNRSSDFCPRMAKRGSLLVCNWPHSVLQGIPLFKSISEDSACKLEDFRFPASRSDDRAILSRRSFVHCSICPDDVPYRPDARQIKHHPSGRRRLPFGPFIASRSFYFSLHLSGRLNSPSRRLSVFDQASDSFHVLLWEN